MATINVKTAPGIARFPMVGQAQAKKYITEEPVEVESSAYYRRALKDGDLLLVDVTPPTTSDRQVPASKAATTQDKATKKASENE